MKKLLLIAFLFLFGCASMPHHVPYDKTEKFLTGAFIAGEVIDTIQTWKFMGGDRFYEANPLIGDRRGLVHMKLGISSVILCTSYFLPHKWRKSVLGFASSVAWGTVFYNYKQGVRIFK